MLVSQACLDLKLGSIRMFINCLVFSYHNIAKIWAFYRGRPPPATPLAPTAADFFLSPDSVCGFKQYIILPKNLENGTGKISAAAGWQGKKKKKRL